MIGNFELTELNADNLPMEKRKQLAITSVFPGISKYHIAALSVFIDEELQNYNICDLSMQNNRFKEVIKSIALDSPGKIRRSIDTAIDIFVPNASDELKDALTKYIWLRQSEIQCAVLSPLVKDVMDIMNIYDAKPNKIVILTTNFTIKVHQLPMNFH